MDENIVVKPRMDNKVYIALVIGGLGVLMGIMVGIIVKYRMSDVYVFIIAGGYICLVFVFLFQLWIASMRTFVLNKKGCQVSIGWYTRMYEWNELQTKRLVTYEYTVCEMPYKICVHLCKKKTKKMKILPSTYCQVFHPFTFVFIFCGEKEKLNYWNKSVADAKMGFFYLVEDGDFLKQLHEWDVDLEKITVKISGKR